MKPPASAIRRILVALDASPSSLAALDAAAELAARAQAELQGIFVEDTDLLRAAESPYGREIAYPYCRPQKLSRSGMERAFRAQAEAARCALADVAERARIPWSFRSVRGDVTRELLAAAEATDLIALGHLGWSLRASGSGSTALELIRCARSVLLLSGREAEPPLRLAVYFDGSEVSETALQTSAQLALSDSGNLTVLVASSDEKTQAKLASEAEQILTGTKLHVSYDVVDPGRPESVQAALRRNSNGVLVLAGEEPYRALGAVLRESKVPFLLLREETR